MTPDEVWRQLQKTCVFITLKNGGRGSAYVIAKGYAGTAAHNLKGWKDGEQIKVRVGWQQPARIVDATILKRDEFADAAVLVLADEACAEIKPFSPGPLPDAETAWRGFGFPSAVREPDGLPVGGKVQYAAYQNGGGNAQMLLQCNEAAAGAGVGMHGFSGTPVIAGDRLVGHFTEQFGDPDDRHRAAFGMVRACPIAAVLALLPPEARPAVLAPAAAPLAAPIKRTRKPKPSDAEVVPNLLSWCDRDEVIEKIQDWLKQPATGGAGLLCLVSHHDHRPNLLLKRIARELETHPPYVGTRERYMVRDDQLDDAESFRRAALKTLQCELANDIASARDFVDGAGLLLVGISCDCKRLSPKQIVQKIGHAAQWISSLALGERRLIVVMTMSDMQPGWIDRLLGRSVQRRVGDAYARLSQDASSTFAGCMLAKPIELGDYKFIDLHNWTMRDEVREGLGHTWNALSPEKIAEWFDGGNCTFDQLLVQLDGLHKENLTWKGRNP